jgi:hypothetical protein
LRTSSGLSPSWFTTRSLVIDGMVPRPGSHRPTSPAPGQADADGAPPVPARHG